MFFVGWTGPDMYGRRRRKETTEEMEGEALEEYLPSSLVTALQGNGI